MIEALKLTLNVIAVMALLYLMAASLAWSFRNPMANRTTFFTHFSAAMSFQSLPQFQEKP